MTSRATVSRTIVPEKNLLNSAAPENFEVGSIVDTDITGDRATVKTDGGEVVELAEESGEWKLATNPYVPR